MTSVKKAGGLAADIFGSLVFDVWAFLLFFTGTTSKSSGIVLLTSVSGLASARALRGRLVVVGIVAIVCLFGC